MSLKCCKCFRLDRATTGGSRRLIRELRRRSPRFHDSIEVLLGADSRLHNWGKHWGKRKSPDNNACNLNYLLAIDGGGGGIRTRDTVSRIHTFQACAFNRSATPPRRLRGAPAHITSRGRAQVARGAGVDRGRCFALRRRRRQLGEERACSDWRFLLRSAGWLLAGAFAAAVIDGARSLAAQQARVDLDGSRARHAFPSKFVLLQPFVVKRAPLLWDPVLINHPLRADFR